ncbi:hypothetical protein DXG01_006059 [Tephrocybe rancida]|nr:hypothetical protein DXG01_006059 [Tephrocybe rancida]
MDDFFHKTKKKPVGPSHQVPGAGSVLEGTPDAVVNSWLIRPDGVKWEQLVNHSGPGIPAANLADFILFRSQKMFFKDKNVIGKTSELFQNPVVSFELFGSPVAKRPLSAS